MKNIAIVGAGQSGLLLSHALLQSGYCVTLFSKQTPEIIQNSRASSSQVMFSPYLDFERNLGLNFWDDDYPCQSKSIYFNLVGTDIRWHGEVNKCFQSIDQRLKFSTWLKIFEAKKGHIIYKDIKKHDVFDISEKYDLTIIASGKSELRDIFPLDVDRTIFTEPARELALIYMKGLIPRQNPGISVNIVPGQGDFFTTPGVGIHGNCEMFLFEAIPGSQFDCWREINNTVDIAKKAGELLKKHIPLEADRINKLKVCHEKDYLFGSYVPFVRKPYVTHKNKYILGVGDTVVLNDPIAGQGANNATKFAEICYECIIENGAQDYSLGWVEKLYSQCFKKIMPATDWTNMLLVQPEQHIVKLFSLAKSIPKIANLISSGFEDPATLFPWIRFNESTREIIEPYLGESAHV